MIQLYIARIDELVDEDLYKKVYNLMPPFRREKVDGIKPRKSKNQSLGAFLLLLYGIKQLGLNIAEFEYTIDSYGYPKLVGEEEIYFSLSHSDDYAICAISDNKIGADIERVVDKDILKISNRFMHSEEDELIQNSTYKQQDYFYRLWTLKESYIKLLGLGLRQELKSFAILFDAEDKPYLKSAPENIDNEYDEHNVHFFEYPCDQEYKCSVAHIGLCNDIIIEKLSVSEVYGEYNTRNT